MDDATALRVEQVKLGFETTDRVVGLRARRHVAILAVALATALSSVGAALTFQPLWPLSAGSIAILGVLAFQQVLALDRLERELTTAGRDANAELETLMRPRGETDADASPV